MARSSPTLRKNFGDLIFLGSSVDTVDFARGHHRIGINNEAIENTAGHCLVSASLWEIFIANMISIALEQNGMIFIRRPGRNGSFWGSDRAFRSSPFALQLENERRREGSINAEKQWCRNGQN
jgi:hypothetical protein